MSREPLQLDEELVALAERLARRKGISIERLLKELLEQASRPADGAGDRVLGLFGDEPDLMEEVLEDAMRSREEQPLRLPRG